MESTCHSWVCTDYQQVWIRSIADQVELYEKSVFNCHELEQGTTGMSLREDMTSFVDSTWLSILNVKNENRDPAHNTIEALASIVASALVTRALRILFTFYLTSVPLFSR